METHKKKCEISDIGCGNINCKDCDTKTLDKESGMSTPTPKEKCNYLEIQDGYHCLRCHTDLSTKKDGDMLEHRKHCGETEVTDCGRLDGKECQFQVWLNIKS